MRVVRFAPLTKRAKGQARGEWGASDGMPLLAHLGDVRIAEREGVRAELALSSGHDWVAGASSARWRGKLRLAEAKRWRRSAAAVRRLALMSRGDSAVLSYTCSGKRA